MLLNDLRPSYSRTMMGISIGNLSKKSFGYGSLRKKSVMELHIVLIVETKDN